MPPGLRQDSLSGVNQNYRQIGGGGASGHVARILLMAWSIGDDEFSLGGRKVAVADIDCNPLFAFRLQAIGDQGKINGSSGTVDPAFFHGGKLVFIYRLGIVEQPSDQRGFPIIHAACGGKTQQALMQVLLEKKLEFVSGRARARVHSKVAFPFLEFH